MTDATAPTPGAPAGSGPARRPFFRRRKVCPFSGAQALIEEQGGQVAKIEYWGLRNLTYRIKKNRKGHYSLLSIDAPAPAVKEMERQLSINEDVLRYLTVRVDELDLELSPVLARRDIPQRLRTSPGGSRLDW